MRDQLLPHSIDCIRPRRPMAIGINVALLVLVVMAQARGVVQAPPRDPFGNWSSTGGPQQQTGGSPKETGKATGGSGQQAGETVTASYRDSVLADSPVGYWEMNELLGTVASDAAGSHNGTYLGLPTLGLPGLVSYVGNLAPGFEGTDDRITANGVASGISWSRGFTLEVWVHVTQTSVEEHAMSFNSSSGAGNGPGLMRDEPTDHFKYRDGHPGTTDYHYALSKTVPAAGRNYYLAVTVNSNNQGSLYVNGLQEATFTTPARPPANGGLFTIGAEYDTGPTPESFWHGPLDEAAVYNYPLSSSRVQAHWTAAAGLRPTCPGFANDLRTQVVGTTGADTLIGTAGNDIICGLGGNDRLIGLGGNDLLLGGDGNDTLLGGAGNDIFDGGPGSDIAQFADTVVASAETVDLSGAAPICSGTPCANNVQLGHDTFVRDPLTGFSTVENLIGTRFDDVFTGDGGANFLAGVDGNDTLTGGGGNDYLRGSGGNDTLVGGDDNDVLFPGVGDDTVSGGLGTRDFVSYSDIETGGVNIDLPSATATGTAPEGSGIDHFSTTEVYYGSPQADTLTGDSGANLLYGFAGSDRLSGGAGADILAGGAGADVIDGGSGTDTANYFSSPGGINLDLAAGTASDGTGSTDTLVTVSGMPTIENVYGSNTGGDTISGSAAANAIDGFGGNDNLDGLDGNDMLNGGVGTDVLEGWKGIDTCIAGESDRHCETITAAATRFVNGVIRTANLMAKTERILSSLAGMSITTEG
jgi:Ca2+-binding RTX toxin-like protein